MTADGATGEAQAIVLGENEPLEVTGGFAAWMVESGSLAVFAVATAEGASERRQFLFHLAGDEILFGMASDSARPAVVAIPAARSTVMPLPATDTTIGLRAEAVERWCGKIGAIIATLRPPENATALGWSGSRSVTSGTAMYWLDEQSGWVRIVSGSARIAGLPSAEVSAGSIVPMASGIWLGSARPFAAEVVTRETAASGIRIGTVRALSGVLLQALQEREDSSRPREGQGGEQQLQLSRSAEAAVEVPAGARRRRVFSDTALLAAVRVVAEAAGMEVRAAMDPNPREHPLKAIAAASGFRVRGVSLSGDWWRRDNGALVAYRLEDQSPIALIPKRGAMGGYGYTLINPLDGSATPVNAEVADSLDSAAFTLYRPLGPSTAAMDLIRFALSSYRRDLGVVILCGMAAGLLGLIAPPATSLLFEHAIPDADRGLLWQITLGMSAALAGSVLFGVAQSISMVRLQSGMSIAIECGIWDRLLRLRPAFFRRFSAGDLWSRADAVDKIRRQLTASVLASAFTAISSLLNIGLMFYYSVPLAAIAAGVGLIVITATAVTVGKLYRLESARQKLEGFLSGFVVQLVSAVGKLRVAGAVNRAFACWAQTYGRKQSITLRIRRSRDAMHVLNTTLPGISAAVILAVMLGGAEEQRLPVGTYLAFSVAFGAFFAGIVSLSETITGLGVVTIWNRVLPILAEEPEVSRTKTHPGKLAGHIRFDRVSFRYQEAGQRTLEEISLEAKPGECVAIAGPSGSGKSTILNLLLQFETPSSGAIYVDGRDLADLDVSAFRRQLGVVNQDCKLIAQSIFENIAWGSLCTMAEAWEAAHAAAIAVDIEQMPMGMHTMVSEGGTNLSGGQRQRLLIARALARKPGILILDEATSALDNHTQRRVTESLKELGITRLIVAQRLSTIREADRIYVIDRGSVVQCGDYETLAQSPGPFARLVQRQLIR